jgi:hypothetical protein
MSEKTFKKGDRVRYTGSSEDRPQSPHWGGKYGKVIGTVTEVSPTEHSIEHEAKVTWDNGKKFYALQKNLSHHTTLLGGFNMKETARNIATSIHDTIKPYEKYIGLIALAVAIDHFLLGNKFTSRFIALGEALVQRITDGMDSVIAKLTDGLLEETDKGEDK